MARFRGSFLLAGLLLVIIGCPAKATEIKLALAQAVDNRSPTFPVVNQSGVAWSDVNIVVSDYNSSAACSEEVVDEWEAGQSRTLPRCGEKTIISIETEGRRAMFALAEGVLYLKVGRKEMPLPGPSDSPG